MINLRNLKAIVKICTMTLGSECLSVIAVLRNVFGAYLKQRSNVRTICARVYDVTDQEVQLGIEL